MLRYILFPFAIVYVIYLRKRFKRLNIKYKYAQSNQHLAILKLIQAKIYYYHSQFDYWGYYHPDCIENIRYDNFLNWLFPQKDYKVIDLVNCYNSAAVTFYLNKMDYKGYNVSCDVVAHKIEKQLIKWGDNY